MTPNPTQEQLLQRYHTDIKQCEPLPQNWRVNETGGYMNTQKECSELYPMCPQARAAGVKLEPEKYLEPYELPGASHVPSFFGYAPADWTWTPGNSPEVLFKALLYGKAMNKEGNLVSQQDVDAKIRIALCETKLDDILYHPMNRTEPVFHDEPLAAKVACAFQRSLWVLCPRLLENVDWNAPWHPEHGQRPNVHVRFGLGEQGDYSPVVIAREFDIENIAKLLRFPNAPTLYVQYALVACHRAILLAPGSIDMAHVARWISQYVEHLISTHSPGVPQTASVPFTYSQTKPLKCAKDLRISPVKLDSWIIAAKRGSPLYVFAERWNRVMAAKIRYTASSTLADWKALLEAQRIVAQLTTSP